LEFKSTKTDEPRRVTVPVSAIASLQAHRRAAAGLSRAVRLRLPHRSGPDFRESGRLGPDSISASVSALFKRLKIPKPKGTARRRALEAMKSACQRGRRNHLQAFEFEWVGLWGHYFSPSHAGRVGAGLAQRHPGCVRRHSLPEPSPRKS
jgi:hypothetical protein